MASDLNTGFSSEMSLNALESGPVILTSPAFQRLQGSGYNKGPCQGRQKKKGKSEKSMEKSAEKEGDALFHQGKEALTVPDVSAAKRFFLEAAAVLSRALALCHDTLSALFLN